MRYTSTCLLSKVSNYSAIIHTVSWIDWLTETIYLAVYTVTTASSSGHKWNAALNSLHSNTVYLYYIYGTIDKIAGHFPEFVKNLSILLKSNYCILKYKSFNKDLYKWREINKYANKFKNCDKLREIIMWNTYSVNLLL